MTETVRFPIFPLPSVILVPGILVPLHIFEPRYRQMVADAVVAGGAFAMAMPVPGEEGDDPRVPRIHPIVGLGRIIQHKVNPDGTSNIVLAGAAKMRVVREIPSSRLYRTVEALPVVDVVPDPDDEVAAVALTHELLDVLSRIPEIDDGDRAGLLALPPGAAIDIIIARLPIAAAEQHRMHADSTVARRVASVRRVLSRLAGAAYPLDIQPGDPRLN